MADDLDDFFNDVEVAEAKVAQEIINEPPAKKQKTDNDLDDFFNEVEESVAKVQEEEVKDPSTKKATAPIRPRGMVVAASSSVILNKKRDDEDEEAELNAALGIDTQNAVSVPPAPPLPQPPSTQPVNSGISGVPLPPPSDKPKKPFKRMAGGKVWEDPSLSEWPENDFRIFCGNLDVTTTDTQLKEHFKKYPSLAMAKIVKDASGNSKGYGFVSFLSPLSCAKAIREMDQTWLGSRPIRVKRSDWKDRNANQVKKKNKQRKKRGY